MAFPEKKRVVYKKNPLDRVICQLRFPPILRIDTEIPAQFQERIRKHFPGFCEKEELPLRIPQGIQRELPMEFIRKTISSENKNYEFSSEDGFWTVNLTRTFIALTTKKYVRRDNFRQQLEGPLKALLDIYAPACFSRVGLRYIDIIRRSTLDLDNVPWNQLLQPHVLGLLSSNEVSDDIKNVEFKYEIQLDDKISMVRIVMGLVECMNNNELCFMIDSDFHTTRRSEISEIKNKLDYFHVQASRLIQWFITDRLHKAMEPEEIL